MFSFISMFLHYEHNLNRIDCLGTKNFAQLKTCLIITSVKRFKTNQDFYVVHATLFVICSEYVESNYETRFYNEKHLKCHHVLFMKQLKIVICIIGKDILKIIMCSSSDACENEKARCNLPHRACDVSSLCSFNNC